MCRWHNAIRAAQVAIDSSRSKCTAQVGFPDPAVSTGSVHQFLSALSNLDGDLRALFHLCDDRFLVPLTAGH
jgi:hypothetical protein